MGIGLTFSQASFLSVVAVSVDRFLAVHLHLRYQELVTHKRVVVVVIATWMLSASNSLLTFLNLQDVCLLTFLIMGCVGVILTTIVYTRIYLIVKRHRYQIQSLQINQVEQTSEMARFTKLVHSAVSFFYVYILLLACYLPLLICMRIKTPKCRQKEIFGSIGDISVSQLIPEPYNLLLEDEKHEALNHKLTKKHVSEPKSHFTFIIGVTLLCQKSLHLMLSMLTIANFHSSSAKKNLRVAMS